MKNLVFILLLSFSFTQDGCTDELACNYDENEDCNYVCYNIDNSLSFDGTNAHVEIPHDNHLNLENEGFTIFTKVMFKAFEDQRRHQILTKSEGAGWHKKWIFGLPNINSGGQGQGGTTNSLVFHAGDEGQRFYARSNEFTPELYKWYDIAVASENGNYTFYIDGDYWGLDSGDGGFADIVSNSADLLIGAKEPNEAWDLHSLDGNIDELLIWNTCLTAEQIFDISHNGNSYDFEPDNIVANWQFNQHNSELNNEYLVDESGNKLHGILNGPEWNVLGCTDQSYGCNYDSESTLDDGSCDYSCHDNGDYSLNFDGQNHVELPFQNNILSTGEFNVRVNFNSINLDAEHVGIYSLGDEPFDGNSKVLLGLHRSVNDNIRFGIYKIWYIFRYLALGR